MSLSISIHYVRERTEGREKKIDYSRKRKGVRLHPYLSITRERKD